MTTFELQGRITEHGKLEIQLPAGLPAGEVTVRIEVPDTGELQEQQSWTADELREMVALTTPDPKTGAEIAAWLEAHPPIDPNWGGITNDEDVAEFVHKMRRTKRLNWGRDE